MKKLVLLLGVSVLMGATSISSAQVSAEVGVLSCDVSAGIGLILEQKQKLDCVFTNGDGATQNYTGSIEKFGLELGEVKEAHMTWTVLAATTTVEAGANADASLGLGAGVNVLIGGTGQAFTFQPVSVNTEKGTAVSAGVETMTLEFNQ